jgi:hypothetical protein
VPRRRAVERGEQAPAVHVVDGPVVRPEPDGQMGGSRGGGQPVVADGLQDLGVGDVVGRAEHQIAYGQIVSA